MEQGVLGLPVQGLKEPRSCLLTTHVDYLKRVSKLEMESLEYVWTAQNLRWTSVS